MNALFVSLNQIDSFAGNPDNLAQLEIMPPVVLGTADVSTQTQRDRLVMEHLPIVRVLARRIHERMPQHVELDDLISAGTMGLIDAASKFDGSKQVQFRSYAQFRVRGAILDSLRTLDWSPRDLRRKGRAMAEALQTLGHRLGRVPTDCEMAEELGMDLTTYQEMAGELKTLEIGSLQDDGNDQTGEEALDVVAAPAGDDPLTRCIAGQTRQQLAAALGELPEKERLVLTLYFYEGMTMREIGLTLGVVESRVSQIRSAALLRLKKTLKRAETAAPGKQGRVITH